MFKTIIALCLTSAAHAATTTYCEVSRTFSGVTVSQQATNAECRIEAFAPLGVPGALTRVSFYDGGKHGTLQVEGYSMGLGDVVRGFGRVEQSGNLVSELAPITGFYETNLYWYTEFSQGYDHATLSNPLPTLLVNGQDGSSYGAWRDITRPGWSGSAVMNYARFTIPVTAGAQLDVSWSHTFTFEQVLVSGCNGCGGGVRFDLLRLDMFDSNPQGTYPYGQISNGSRFYGVLDPPDDVSEHPEPALGLGVLAAVALIALRQRREGQG